MVADGCQRHKADAILKALQAILGKLKTKARLAHATWPGQGEQAHVLAGEQGGCTSQVLLTPNERGRWDRQVVRRAQKWLPDNRKVNVWASSGEEQDALARRESQSLDEQVKRLLARGAVHAALKVTDGPYA